MLSLRRWTARLQRWRGDRSGVVALEFALIGPVMIILVIGVFDISKGLILYQEVYNAAHTIALSASIMAVQSDQTTSLTYAQSQQAMSAIYAEMPWVRDGIESGTISVAMASVTFLPVSATCAPSATVTCATNATVVWRSVYVQNPPFSLANSSYRACGTLTQRAADAVGPGDLTSIGTGGVTNPAPILVVDVHYRYTPSFFTFMSGPIDLWASGYWPVRSSPPGTVVDQQYTRFDLANQLAGYGKCAGYGGTGAI